MRMRFLTFSGWASNSRKSEVASVATKGLETGVGVGVGCSLATRINSSARNLDWELGRISSGVGLRDGDGLAPGVGVTNGITIGVGVALPFGSPRGSGDGDGDGVGLKPRDDSPVGSGLAGLAT